ncbi:MAG: hypothetical protein EB127_16765, partial [Alphaproteobacteria bacterium]|nr:hypothetical protein [Alphaproteobacteria bacterium]
MIIGFVQNAINAIYRKIKNRKIIFYITDTTVQVAYYKKDELIDSYISKSDNLKTDLDFVEYLHKRKKSNAKFIVQSRQITSEKISIPILGTFGNINPIENYCLTHLTPDMLYTYKVHAITKDRSEIWKSTVSYMPFTEKVSQCFELLYQNHTPFFGLYFHKVIADQIVTLIGEENKINLENYIYAIICILNEEELSLNLFHAGNILHSSIVTIPKNESDNYLSGLVDQTLQDSWIKFKSYIQHEKLSKLSIFLVNNNLKRLLIGSKKNDELYIFPEDSTLENPFQIFIHYFFKSRQLPAINQAISQYKRYRKVDSMVFPPLYILFGSAILCILYINMLAYYNNNITSYLYKEYTQITQEIREAGKSYPETKNLI